MDFDSFSKNGFENFPVEVLDFILGYGSSDEVILCRIYEDREEAESVGSEYEEVCDNTYLTRTLESGYTLLVVYK